MKRDTLRIALPIASVTLFLVGWSLYVRSAEVSAFVLPPPEAIIAALSVMLFDPKLWSHTLVTVIEALSGFGIAVTLGLTLGFTMARVPPVEWALKPFVPHFPSNPLISLSGWCYLLYKSWRYGI